MDCNRDRSRPSGGENLGETPSRGIGQPETRAALEDDAALAAYLVHIARLRHLRRLPSAAAARAAGW